LGSLHAVGALSHIEKYNGLIATLPTSEEGTRNKENAMIAATEIINANEKIELFRPMIFIDNQQLQGSLIGSMSYEESLVEMNKIFCSSFLDIYDFSTRPALTSFDPEEYRRMLMEKGCVLFAKDDFDYNPKDSDTCMLTMLKDLWKKSIFLTGDYSKATAAAVIIERPENFDTDGVKINAMFSGAKEYIGSGYFCRGVYRQREGMIKKKPLTIATILSGIPAPIERINKLAEDVEKERQQLEEKRTQAPKLSVRTEELKKQYFQEAGLKKPAKVNLVDLTVFNFEEEEDGKPFKWGNFEKKPGE
jgi:cell division GTPase FtsZ